MARVLVVDDEADIREAVSEVLSDEGYDVEAAGDGAEALRKLHSYHPCLVLLDLMMPGMNGWEFRAAQKHDPEVSKIPVVVLSALGRVGSIDAQGFLPKPFELDDLLSQVKRWVDSASADGGGMNGEPLQSRA
jgi:CheY-like chemotaxis protein